jgi:hypothetical protein
MLTDAYPLDMQTNSGMTAGTCHKVKVADALPGADNGCLYTEHRRAVADVNHRSAYSNQTAITTGCPMIETGPAANAAPRFNLRPRALGSIYELLVYEYICVE